MRAVVATRIARRERGILVGGLIGLAVGILAAAFFAWSRHGGLEGVIILSFAGLGRAVGSFHAAVGDEVSPDLRAPRVARLRAATVVDYSTPAEVVATQFSLASVPVALVCTGVVWALTPVRPGGGFVVPLVLVLVAGAAFTAMTGMLRGARRVVERSRPAQDDLELAWHDVLRSEGIRDLQGTSNATGLLVVLGLLATAGTWVITPEARYHGMQLTMELGLTAGAVGMVCWAVVIVPWFMGRQVRDPSRAVRPTPPTARTLP